MAANEADTSACLFQRGAEMCMRPHLRSHGVALILILISAAIGMRAKEPIEDEPDWWTMQRDLVSLIADQNLDIIDLAQAAAGISPQTGRVAMFKLNVLMRAGMHADAAKALRELKLLCPDLDNYQVTQIYYAACDEFLAWELAQRVVEVFADNVSELNLENRLLEHLLESGRNIEEIDRWLAGMPTGRDGFWIKERLRFSNVHGRAQRLIEELTGHIRRDPNNIEHVIVFLDGLAGARHTGQESWDLSWLPETIHPRLATQMERIASRLQMLAQWQTSATFYRQAVDMSLTDEEVQDRGANHQMYMPPEKVRAAFDAQVRDGLAKCLLEMDRAEEAQKWMVESADIRAEHGFGLHALFAGQVQQASGQRVIERRMWEEEEQRADDPEYWRRRALYYRGRNEPDQEEYALQRGLALTTPQPRPQTASKGYTDMRRWLLGDYAHFLMRMDRTPEAVALLRSEIEQAPAEALSAERAANLLAFTFEKHVTAGDALLWTWLAHRPKWEHTESRLLWRMLESVPREGLEPYFEQAESLASQADPSRATALGWIMNRMGHPKRSIALLEYAVEKASNSELREEATFTLFESCLDAGHWKRAEQIFPEARKRLSPTEVPTWCSRIAAVAGQAGDRDDALRIWRVAARLNPSDLTSLPALAAAGLHDQLAAFYWDMATKLPSSETPPRALTMLGDRVIESEPAPSEAIPFPLPPRVSPITMTPTR